MEYESETLNLLAACTDPKILDLEAGLQHLKADSACLKVAVAGAQIAISMA